MKSLRDYLNDEDAPSGFVYLIDDKPLVQVDFFEHTYTLFWLGAVKPESFLAESVAILEETLLQDFPRPSLIFPFRHRPSVIGLGSVVRKQRVEEGFSLSRTYEKLKYRATGFRRDVLRLEQLLHLGDDTANLAAIQIDFELIEGPIRRFSIWGDTDMSPKTEKEVGFTLDTSIADRPSVRKLLLETSPDLKELPHFVFDDLFGLVSSTISQRNY